MSTFTPGISLFSVVARDEDSGRNGEISYSIVSSQRTGLFRIDTQTGEFKGYIKLRLTLKFISFTLESYV